MKSDIEIAQEAKMKPIADIAASLGLADEDVIPYGRYKAKVNHRLIHKASKQGKLILVTAISPTPAGEGKTTTSVGLADAMNAIGKKTMLCLREPSLGPVFGIKGGAAGGGYAQVVPMEDINLHFTGDIHAIGTANNLLAAMGMEKYQFMTDKGLFRYILIFSLTWKESGWSTILYIAAITGIDPALYEAATIDGANRFQRIWYITIPGIMNMIAIQFVLRVGAVMEGGFDQIFNLYTAPVYDTGDIIDTYIYRLSFVKSSGVNLGFPTAVGLFKNVINFILLMLANGVTRALGQETVL